MSFKIKNNIIDLQSITNAPLNFGDSILPYGKGMYSNISPTDDQSHLRSKKAVAVLCGGFSCTTAQTTCDGLTKRTYILGTPGGAYYGICTVTWLRSLALVYIEGQGYLNWCPANTRGYCTNYGLRCVHDTCMYGRTYFLRYCNYTSDGCLKLICVG